MFKTVILTILLALYLNASEVQHNSSPSYETSISLLKSIERDGLIYGKGKRLVYVFLDPLCPYSRKFISMVSQNPKMLLKYRYCIYLYSIPRLHSTDAVSAVYLSKKPIDTLLKIMIAKQTILATGTPLSKQRVQRIATVAKKMNVNKRPFLIIQK
ncbi:hypothetical protein [Sulfurimonas marina]|uniref:Thioredoxin-like fold domain-containing protein n=1 Tax=Sulfurimonas marina TaxID=2590551 RepID=A0A7M1ATF0_9BACT|nr:hypothetical protein [Sulfurimonas marina]QOP40694.1 hypothetical protein FJR03_02625 [Sulfurimonas marina]